MLLSIVMLFVVSKLAIVGIPPTWAQTAEQAKQADRLVDSIGVNTHFGYHNVYSSDYQGLKSKLGKLAVRHIRDGVNSINGPRIRELYKLYGIRLTAIAGRRVDGSYDKPLELNAIDDELTDIKKYALAATEAIEGPNEYDISHGSDSDWVSRIRRYQKLLYSKVKSDTLLKNRPILGPSLTSEEAYKKLAILRPLLTTRMLILMPVDAIQGLKVGETTAMAAFPGFSSIILGDRALLNRLSLLSAATTMQ